jgi:hypothetical protein
VSPATRRRPLSISVPDTTSRRRDDVGSCGDFWQKLSGSDRWVPLQALQGYRAGLENILSNKVALTGALYKL